MRLALAPANRELNERREGSLRIYGSGVLLAPAAVGRSASGNFAAAPHMSGVTIRIAQQTSQSSWSCNATSTPIAALRVRDANVPNKPPVMMSNGTTKSLMMVSGAQAGNRDSNAAL